LSSRASSEPHLCVLVASMPLWVFGLRRDDRRLGRAVTYPAVRDSRVLLDTRDIGTVGLYGTGPQRKGML